jgi:hypothetical protein
MVRKALLVNVFGEPYDHSKIPLKSLSDNPLESPFVILNSFQNLVVSICYVLNRSRNIEE